jgi:hypothetical protein
VSDEFDVAIPDAEALDEIEMLTNLIIETSKSRGPVPQGRIDEILGVPHPTGEDGAQATPAGSAGPA